MSLPACQERTLSGIEGALKASEPHLASMFTIFARLNQGEPVGAEPIERDRLRWLRPRTAASAIVLLPVMFAAIIAGALLGGNARGATTCAADGVSALVHRLSCPQSGATAAAKPASATTASTKTGPAKTGPAKTGPAKTGPAETGPARTESSEGNSPCQAVRFTTMNGGDQALSPPGPAATVAIGLPGVC